MPPVPLPPQTKKGRSNPIQNTHIPPLSVESYPLSNVRHLHQNEQQNDLPLQTDSSQVTSTHEKKQIIIKRKNISKPQENLTFACILVVKRQKKINSLHQNGFERRQNGLPSGRSGSCFFFMVLQGYYILQNTMVRGGGGGMAVEEKK